MKITKLPRGYRLDLSDGEFEALELLVTHGLADSEGADDFADGMTLAGKRGLGRLSKRGAWATVWPGEKE